MSACGFLLLFQTQPLSPHHPLWENWTVFSRVSDSKSASPTTPSGGCSGVPLRNSNIFPAVGAVFGEATPLPHKHLLLDTIPAKGVEGELAMTVWKRFSFLLVGDAQEETSLSFTTFHRGTVAAILRLRRGGASHTLRITVTLRSWSHLWVELSNPGASLLSDFSLWEKIHFLSFKPS